MVDMRILNLFSGTGSVEKELSEDDECVSLDISNEFYQPTIQTDIMSWDYKSSFDVRHFDVIISAPPCTHYSKLRDICKALPVPPLQDMHRADPVHPAHPCSTLLQKVNRWRITPSA